MINTKTTKYVINDFTVDKTDYTDKFVVKEQYGYQLKNRKLTTGLGFEPLTLPRNLTSGCVENIVDYSSLKDSMNKLQVFSYFKGYHKNSLASNKYDRRLQFYGSDGGIYELTPFVPVTQIWQVYNGYFNLTSIPVALNIRQNGEDMIILSNLTDNMLVWKCTTNAPQAFNLDYHLTSLCENDGILYATTDGDAKTLFFTTTLDPTLVDETNSGTIDLTDNRGASLKVISFKGYVYVFREYGITKLTRLASGTYAISQLYSSPSRIYEKTVAVCGDKIIFLSRNGLNSFNGINVSKITTPYDDVLCQTENSNAMAECLGNKYYLACTLNFPDLKASEQNLTHNAFMAVDITNFDTSVVRSVDIASMLAVNDFAMQKLVVTFNNANQREIGQLCEKGKFLTNNTTKTICTNRVDFGANGRRISKVEVNASLGTKIDIVTDSATLHFVCTKDGYNAFAPYAKATSAKIMVDANSDTAYLDEITLTTTEIK